MAITVNGKTVAGTPSQALPLKGGTMKGPVNMDSNKITGIPTPAGVSDAVPKTYVDTEIQTAKDYTDKAIEQAILASWAKAY